MTIKSLKISTSFLFAALVASGQARPTTGILFNPGGYKLGYGDEVSIQVFGEPEVAVQTNINREGTVRLVYISGEVPIIGLTTKEAEVFIAKQYFENRIYSKATVNLKITKYAAKEVMFTGKFSKTGPFAFPPEVAAMDIVEAITRNGGFQEIAKTAEVKVTRTVHDKTGGSVKETYTVDVKARMEGDANLERFLIYPGDTLFVREKLI